MTVTIYLLPLAVHVNVCFKILGLNKSKLRKRENLFHTHSSVEVKAFLVRSYVHTSKASMDKHGR